MFVDSPTEGNLFALFGTSRCRQCDRDLTTFERGDPSSRLRSSNVDEKRFAHSQFCDLCFFRVIRLDTEQSTE